MTRCNTKRFSRGGRKLDITARFIGISPPGQCRCRRSPSCQYTGQVSGLCSQQTFPPCLTQSIKLFLGCSFGGARCQYHAGCQISKDNSVTTGISGPKVSQFLYDCHTIHRSRVSPHAICSQTVRTALISEHVCLVNGLGKFRHERHRVHV